METTISPVEAPAKEAPAVIDPADLPRDPMLGLWGLIKEDIWRNGGWHRPGSRAMVSYRCARAARKIKNPILGPIVRRITTSMLRYCRNSYGIELFDTMDIGRRFQIGHQSAIVLHEYAIIGHDCAVRQGCTWGLAGKAALTSTPENAPIIGDRVDFGAGSIVLGGVKIGDDVKIFPNAVVVTDVPAKSTVMTPMARAMPQSAPPKPAAQ